MTSVKSVNIFTADRAERGLLEPVFGALADEGLNPVWFSLEEGERVLQSIGREYLNEFRNQEPVRQTIETVKRLPVFISAGLLAGCLDRRKADFAIVPCDRQEMAGVALGLFCNNIPFAQFDAGALGSGVHDEVYRWIIARMATLHFCNSAENAQNLVRSGEEPWRVNLIGSTAFDDVEISQALVPKEPFDLLLVHPDTFSKEQAHKDMLHALSLIDKLTVMIGPNKDMYHEVVEMGLSNYHDRSNRTIYYQNGVKRPEFLGLMKHCQRFITNSSSALYELPAFDIRKWVNIGKRNAERKPLDKIVPGGSKRIAEIIKGLNLTPELLRKRFTV